MSKTTDTATNASPVRCIDSTLQIPLAPIQLATAFQRVAFAADPDSTRYALGCVQMRIDSRGFEFTSTDSRRLSTFRIDVAHYLPECEFLLNCFDVRKFVRAVNSKALGKSVELVLWREKRGEQRASIYWLKRGTKGKDDLIESTFEVSEGRFPRWESIVPDAKSFPVCIQLTAGEILRDLPASWGTETLFDIEETEVKFQPATKPGTFQIMSNQIRDGFGGKFSGSVSECLDASYLRELCDKLPAKAQLKFYVAGDGTAALIEWNDSLRYVFMPLDASKV